MRKRTIFVAIVIMASFGLQRAYGLDEKNAKAGLSQAPKVESPQAAIQKAKPGDKEREKTREEMLAELKEDVAGEDEIFTSIPELKAQAGQNGSAIYTYKNTALDELSKEDMTDLYRRVRQALTKIRADRIQKQLEMIRQVEAIQRTVKPPQAPRVPAAPPSVPRTPPPPPPAPQRR